MAWKPLERVRQRPTTLASRASRHSLGHFAMQHGRLASDRRSVCVTMGLPILWSSCSITRPPFGRREAMGVSWPIGS
jgi:hypothetical protein